MESLEPKEKCRLELHGRSWAELAFIVLYCLLKTVFGWIIGEYAAQIYKIVILHFAGTQKAHYYARQCACDAIMHLIVPRALCNLLRVVYCRRYKSRAEQWH